MKISSWNVNGIRAIEKKGFWDWFYESNADIVCLQETKAFPDQLKINLQKPENYYSYWHNGQKKGYSGVVTYSKIKAKSIYYAFSKTTELFKNEGRIVQTNFDNFILLNIYFPNGNERADQKNVLNNKLDFYKCFLNYLNELKNQGKEIIACGDYNIAHTEMDIARPKENKNEIGFLPIERKELSKIIEHGYIDVFRHLNPNKKDHYTWWSYRARARERNVGWRIDYFFISPNLINKINSITHETNIMGSDHCPLSLEIKI